jgi:hypothetical protein
MLQRPLELKDEARAHAEGARARQVRGEEPGQFGPQAVAQPLVGIEIENPVVSGAILCEALLRPETAPRIEDDARAEPLADSDGIVGRPRIDHEDFVDETTHGGDGLIDPIGLVSRNDRAGDRQHEESIG